MLLHVVLALTATLGGCEDIIDLAQTLEPPAASSVKPFFVYVTRHCVRGTGKPKDKMQAFASLPPADWDSPDEWCTGGGLQITTKVGEFLRDHFGWEAGKVSVTTATLMRHLQSAHALMEGIFGDDHTQQWTLTADATIAKMTELVPQSLRCEAPDKLTQMSEIEHLFKTTPLPGDLGMPDAADSAKWRDMLQSFRSLIGVGEEDILTIQPPNFTRDVTWGGSGGGSVKVGGAPAILKYFSQQMFYAKASGTGYEGDPISFGGKTLNASIQELYPLYMWEAYQRQVSDPPSLKATWGVSLAHAVLEKLTTGEPGNGHIFSDSDSQIDALRHLFNVTWSAPPFGGSPGPTPPNTALMFAKYPNGTVTVSVVTVRFDGTLQPEVRVIPANPAATTVSNMARLANSTLTASPAAAACARKFNFTFDVT